MMSDLLPAASTLITAHQITSVNIWNICVSFTLTTLPCCTEPVTIVTNVACCYVLFQKLEA